LSGKAGGSSYDRIQITALKLTFGHDIGQPSPSRCSALECNTRDRLLKLPPFGRSRRRRIFHFLNVLNCTQVIKSFGYVAGQNILYESSELHIISILNSGKEVKVPMQEDQKCGVRRTTETKVK